MAKWVFRNYGGPSVLKLEDDTKAELSTGKIAIRVEAFSINPIDWKLMSGSLRFIAPVKFPSVPCFDVAGVVEDDNGVAGFKKGDRVFVRLNEPTGGAAQSRIVTDASVVAKMPVGMSFEEGAAIPLAGLTALQGLRDHGGMSLSNANLRVLVIGASGGVGHYAVQIAAAAGAHVTAVCSTKNVEFVTKLGAHEVIDYLKQESFASADGQPYDLILDCVGQTPFQFARRFKPFLKPDGKYVTPAPNLAILLRGLFFWRRPKVVSYLMKPSRADLEVLSTMFVEGKLKSNIESKVTFADLPDAFSKAMTGRTVGKIVVTLGN